MGKNRHFAGAHMSVAVCAAVKLGRQEGAWLVRAYVHAEPMYGLNLMSFIFSLPCLGEGSLSVWIFDVPVENSISCVQMLALGSNAGGLPLEMALRTRRTVRV